MEKFGLKLDVLRTNEERAKGYQYADKPTNGTGLLFVFTPPEKPSFHMRNVTFPLQITFFDAAWKMLKTDTMQPQTGGSQCNEFCTYVIECNPSDLKTIASLRLGETAQFVPNHDPYLNWANEDVPIQSEKVPPFNTWWKQPRKYKDELQPRGRQKTDMQNMYTPEVGIPKWHEVAVGTTIIVGGK